MQALDRELDINTAYGGRFVQSIEGVEGDVSKQRDWFWFLNGIEADQSAADYRLRPGDVEWWDFRSWEDVMREPVVVGAFPEPFQHGYGEPQAAAGRRALRAGVGERRPRDRSPPERRLGPARFRLGSQGRECVLHSKRHAAVLGFAPATTTVPPARRWSSSSLATLSSSRAIRGDSASATRSREPGPRRSRPRLAGSGGADLRPRMGRGRDRRSAARPLSQGALAAGAGSTSRARFLLAGAHRVPAQPVRRARGNGTSCGPAPRSP